MTDGRKKKLNEKDFHYIFINNYWSEYFETPIEKGSYLKWNTEAEKYNVYDSKGAKTYSSLYKLSENILQHLKSLKQDISRKIPEADQNYFNKIKNKNEQP